MLAALTWAVYSVLTRKIGNHGYNSLQATRRIFFYGLLFMLPCLPIFGFSWNFARFAQPVDLGNMLFLGLGASALCFVTWTFSLKRLGAVKTSVYIYLGAGGHGAHLRADPARADHLAGCGRHGIDSPGAGNFRVSSLSALEQDQALGGA